MIKVDNVNKIYNLDGEEFYALKDINLEVKQGEFTAILGPSGCGKSTLMHIIGLLDTPTSGRIIINGQNVTSLNDNELSRLRNEFCGFIFQQFNLINKLTVLENILLPILYSNKKYNINMKERALSLMEKFGILNKQKLYPNKLSGGQQQRVAIARALLNEPKFILADEPTGNLDSKTGQNIMNLIMELNEKEGITVILVTHDREIAQQSRRHIRMLDGKII